jgi:hypothetical protein
MNKCPRYLKQWVLPPEKEEEEEEEEEEEMNKIAHIFLQSCFQV